MTDEMALTDEVTDWSGRDYAEVSGLQRAMITDALAALQFAPEEWVLDIGCGDGFLTAAIADLVPDGYAVGADASPRMIATAATSAASGSGPHFVVADARSLPLTECFDVVVSFNALHWVRPQRQALEQIAAVLKPGGRAILQLVCAGERESLESVAMRVSRTSRWTPWFVGYEAPFIHPDPAGYGSLAASAGLTCTGLTVTDRDWDFGSRVAFERWCGVGSTAWTDRLPQVLRDDFVADEVTAYEPVAGRAGLFRFTQMRAEFAR